MKKENISILCEFENCKAEGVHKAPKKGGGYYHFCKKHVEEYNKNWNYYRDMKEEQVQKLNDFDLIGRRNTWKTGVGISQEMLKKIKGLEDPFEILKKYSINFDFSDKTPTFAPTIELDKACKVLGIQFNITPKELSKIYKELSKKYHPDLNHGNKQKEEKFKEISNAYNLIIKNIKK